MDTELLKTFLEVRKTRHFGRAAESLYLTQSTVSFRIRQLEQQLGVHLFTRHKNNIRLTPAGERLVPYAETLMNTWQLAKKEVMHSHSDATISIGAIASLWEAYLTPWLQVLCLQQKSLRVETQIAPRKLLITQLYEREIDLLITTDLSRMDELESQLLGKLSLQLYSSAQKIRADNIPYIKLKWGGGPHQQEHNLNEQITVLTTTSAYLAHQLLETTGGCVWLPQHWGEKYPQLMAWPDTPAIVRPLYAFWLKNSDQRLLIRELLKIPIKNIHTENLHTILQ